jgi:ankyrin repeat protein
MQKTTKEKNVLQIAVHADEQAVIDLLTDSGFSVDLVTKYRAEGLGAGLSIGRQSAEGAHNIESLILAALRGNVHVMEQLVQDHGVDSNGVDEYGMTAVHWAAQYDQLEAVMWLVGRGALALGVAIRTARRRSTLQRSVDRLK